MGSVILRKYVGIDEDGKSDIKVKMRTLTILGIKDGLLRITRGAEAYYH